MEPRRLRSCSSAVSADWGIRPTACCSLHTTLLNTTPRPWDAEGSCRSRAINAAEHTEYACRTPASKGLGEEGKAAAVRSQQSSMFLPYEVATPRLLAASALLSTA